jgi:hypothetical protein
MCVLMRKQVRPDKLINSLPARCVSRTGTPVCMLRQPGFGADNALARHSTL